MKVLHLIDSGAGHRSEHCDASGDAAMFACRSLQTQTPEHKHDICLVGGSGGPAIARSHGLNDVIHLAAPGDRRTLAFRSLRRVLTDRGRPDVIHSWSASALGLHRAAASEIPAAATFIERPNTHRRFGSGVFPRRDTATWWLSRSLLRTSLTVFSEQSKSSWRQAFPETRSIRVAPLPRVNHRIKVSKDSFRKNHGIGEQELVLLSLGQSPAQSDAMRFMFLLDVLHVTTPGVVGLISSGSSQIARGLRFQARRKNSWRVLISDNPMPDLLAAADIAVCEGSRFTAVSDSPACSASTIVQICAAHQMGVPVVAQRNLISPQIYPPLAEKACAAINSALPELARKILPLHNDREHLALVADQVVAAANAIDGRDFAATIEAAWQETLNATGNSTESAGTLTA